MIQQVFKISSTQSAACDWHEGVLGNRSRMIPSSFDHEAGLSAGITVTWLKKSIASEGKGISQIAELGSQHLMAIIQGAFAHRSIPGSQWTDIIDSTIPLLHSQNLRAFGGIRGKGVSFMPPDQIVYWALKNPGYSLLSFRKKGQRGAFGHMLGMRCEGKTLQMFDADRGLFQYSTISSFKEHMQQYFSVISSTSPDLQWDFGICSVRAEKVGIIGTPV